MKKKRRKTARSVVMDMAIAALLLLCVFLYLRASGRHAERRAETLEQAYQSEAKALYNREQGEAIYRRMVDEVQQSLPGFACWGDDLMAGADRLNLPAALENALWRTLYADLSVDFTKYAGLRVALTGLLPAHNLGFPGEGLREVMARSGANPIVVSDGFTIPRTTDPVAVALMDGTGRELAFDGENHARMGRVEIAGVKGYFYPGSKAVDQRNARLSFGRELAGEPIEVSARTIVTLDAADRFTRCLPILFFREPDDMTADEAAAGMEAIVKRHNLPGGACMVLCETPRGSALDSRLKATFGEYYIRVDAEPQTPDYAKLADTLLTYLDMQGALDGPCAAISAARESLRVLS